jgi:hypothetical protein
VQNLTEFLLSLRDNDGLRPTTIEGYRSVISVTVKAIGGQDFGQNVQLTNLLLNMRKSSPAVRPQPPTWDLAFVLKVLEGPPFEPLLTVALKFVTFKTVFLTAFATAKRRSEIHALVLAGLEHTEHWTSVTIHSNGQFLPKTSLQSLPPVTIPALASTSGPLTQADHLLCTTMLYSAHCGFKGGEETFVYFPPDGF